MLNTTRGDITTRSMTPNLPKSNHIALTQEGCRVSWQTWNPQDTVAGHPGWRRLAANILGFRFRATRVSLSYHSHLSSADATKVSFILAKKPGQLHSSKKVLVSWVSLGPQLPQEWGPYNLQFRWSAHPVIVIIGDHKDYIRVPLHSYYITITGWGVLLSQNCIAEEVTILVTRHTRVSGSPTWAPGSEGDLILKQA